MIVDIGGGQTAEFPDDMPEADIAAAIHSFTGAAPKKEASGKEFVGGLAGEIGQGLSLGGMPTIAAAADTALNQPHRLNLGTAPARPAGVPLGATWDGAKFTAYPDKAWDVQGNPTSAESIFGSDFQQTKDYYKGKLGEFKKENPLLGTAAEVGGSLPGAMATGGAALAGLRGVAAGSRLAPAVNYLTGTGGGTSILARAGSRMLGGSVEGGAQGAATSGLSDADIPDTMATGAAFGAGLGGVGGLLGQTMRNLAGNPLGAARMEAARHMIEDLGVPLSWPQVLGRTGAVKPGQLEQWTRLMSHQIGEDSEALTPDVMDQAAKRIGSVLDEAAVRTGVAVDTGLRSDLASLQSRIRSSTMSSGERDALQQRIAMVTAKPMMSGENYQQLTAHGGPLDELIQDANPTVKNYALQLRDTVDGALERSSLPEDVAALRTARGQWKNLQILRDIPEKNSITGLPQAGDFGRVLSDTIRKNPQFYRNGGGEIGRLATLGDMFLRGSQTAKAGVGAHDLVMPTYLGAVETMLHGFNPETMALAAGLGLVPRVGKMVGDAMYHGPGYAARRVRPLTPGMGSPGNYLVPGIAPNAASGIFGE